MRKIDLTSSLRVFFVFVFSILSGGVYAQEKIEGEVNTDVVSRYVWRGTSLGDAAVQPSASLSWQGLCLGAWGSFAFIDSNDTREFDLTLSYTTKGFNVGVTDYWFSYSGMVNKYLEYNNDKTSHIWEGNIGYDLGYLNLQWYTNFAGADGINKNGKRAYSSYFEVSVPFKLAECEWNAIVGIVPYATSFYSGAEDGFALTNIGLRCTKDINICNKFSIPVFGEISGNTETKKGFLVVGLTLSPFQD